MRKPTDTQCPVCDDVFTQPIRKQGGGRLSIYCSLQCRSVDWTRGHGASRKASILKYDNKPTSKAQKRQRSRRHTLSRYGLSDADYFSMLERQQKRCAGCGRSIDESAHIDHDNNTNRVRGLLCRQCNTALGFVKDDRSRLYQLAAYLEIDRSRPVVYLVGSLRNPNVVELGNKMRSLGLEVVDNWFAAGKIADDSWQEYSVSRGRTYQEALESREAAHVFYFDRAYINLSDAVVLLYPAGKSAHLEFGYAIGRGKRGYIMMEETPDRYDVMLQFAHSPLFDNNDKLLTALKKDLL